MADALCAVVVSMCAKPGMEEALKAELRALVGPVRSTAGAAGQITYDQHQDRADPSLFMIYELWLSQEHWEEYHKDDPPALKAFVARSPDLLATPFAVQLMDMISPPMPHEGA